MRPTLRDPVPMPIRSTPWLVLLSLLFATQQGRPQHDSSAVHYYVQLIWGTNYKKPEAADFRPVGSKLKEELSRVFQWKQYWEANSKEVIVSPGKPVRTRLSPECEVEIELVSAVDRETRIFGKGILVTRSRRNIHCRNFAIHGGGSVSGSSWFVVVREDEPKHQ